MSALLGHLGATHSNGLIKRTTGFKQTASGDLNDLLKSTQKSLFAMELLLGVTSEFTEQEQLHAISGGDPWKVSNNSHYA